MISVLLTNHFMTQQVFMIHYSWFVDCILNILETTHTHGGVRVVLCPCICPSRQKMVWWTKSNLLGLLSIPNVIRTNVIVGLFIHYYLYSSLSTQVFEPFVSGCGVKCFECCSGYKACTSPRCLTWLTRLLIFVKGWGLGHSTKAKVQRKHGPLFSHPLIN